VIKKAIPPLSYAAVIPAVVKKTLRKKNKEFL
jgi:hypothetical protein